MEKINPKEFPRNPAISSKLNLQEIFDAAQSSLETLQKMLSI